MVNLKRFLLLSVLFSLLLPVCLSAEVCLDDDEFTELEEIFKRLGNTLDEQSEELEMLNKKLAKAENDLELSLIEMNRLRGTLQEAQRSLRTHDRDRVIQIIIATAVSLLLGGLAGVIFF